MRTDFLKEWTPFDTKYKKVKNAIRNHFMSNTYQFQPTHDERSKRPFKPVSFSQIDNTLGLAYTSTGAYAGLWCCNAGYLWADDTHHFTGFAIDEQGRVIGIADDEDENEIYITL